MVFLLKFNIFSSGYQCVNLCHVDTISSFYVLFVFIGTVASLDVIWGFSSIMNGLMAIPNIIALFALSGVVAKETRDYFKKKQRKES